MYKLYRVIIIAYRLLRSLGVSIVSIAAYNLPQPDHGVRVDAHRQTLVLCIDTARANFAMVLCRTGTAIIPRKACICGHPNVTIAVTSFDPVSR